MFYDVLQQLCHKKNILYFNKAKITKKRRINKVLKAFGVRNMITNELTMVLDRKIPIAKNFD